MVLADNELFTFATKDAAYLTTVSTCQEKTLPFSQQT